MVFRGIPLPGRIPEGGRQVALLWLHDRSHPDISCFVPYFEYAFEKNSRCAGYGYFKDGSPENSDLYHYGKAVAFPNGKYNYYITI